MLRVTDLFKKCGDCGGSGEVMHPDWYQWWERCEANPVCPPTRHPLHDIPEYLECPYCYGTGYYPNAEGTEFMNILAVAQAHMKGRKTD